MRLNSTGKFHQFFSYINMKEACFLCMMRRETTSNLNCISKTSIEMSKLKFVYRFILAGFLNCNSTTLQSLAQLQGKLVSFSNFLRLLVLANNVSESSISNFVDEIKTSKTLKRNTIVAKENIRYG